MDGTVKSWHRGIGRPDVAAAALAILDTDGWPALTMRRVAQDLDVKAASLYTHIADKDDLLDAVLDLVLDSIELPPRRGRPRAALVRSFRAYRKALVAHPRVVRLMTQRSRLSMSQVRLVERSVELLTEAGLSMREAVDAHVALVAFTLGFLMQEVGRPPGPPPPGALERPLFRATLESLAERPVDERFDVGLARILDGVLAAGR